MSIAGLDGNRDSFDLTEICAIKFKPNSSQPAVSALKMYFWRVGMGGICSSACVFRDPDQEPNKTLINACYCQHQNKHLEKAKSVSALLSFAKSTPFL